MILPRIGTEFHGEEHGVDEQYSIGPGAYLTLLHGCRAPGPAGVKLPYWHSAWM